MKSAREYQNMAMKTVTIEVVAEVDDADRRWEAEEVVAAVEQAVGEFTDGIVNVEVTDVE